MKRRFAKADESGEEHGFVRGFVTASLLYCVGPLTILGAIQDASGQTPQLYIIKGSLDGFISVIFAAIYGVGVMFSAVSVFIVQGSLTALGTSIDSLLDDRMRLELLPQVDSQLWQSASTCWRLKKSDWVLCCQA